MGRVGTAISLAWLATFWLIGVFVLSIFSAASGLDVFTLLIALIAQAVVVIAWTVYRRLPLWIVAGHGLILLALVLGLAITAPQTPLPDPLPALALPWLVAGLVPTGVAMLVAAPVAWNRQHVVGH